MIQIDNALQNLKEKDGYLEPFFDDIKLHLSRYNDARRVLGNKSLSEIATAHKYFGFHRKRNGWVFREWLPGADAAWLCGDFNQWRSYEHPLTPLATVSGKSGWKAGMHCSTVSM